MKRNYVRQFIFPLLAAMIWGAAFVAQSIGAETIGCFAFTMARSAIAAVELFILTFILRLVRHKKRTEEEKKAYRKDLIYSGFFCGTILMAATNFQQFGLGTTDAGKAGFITALYVVLVPVFGLPLHKKVTPTICVSVALAVGGLYLLCVRIGAPFSVTRGDLSVLICAALFAVHILCIDHYSDKVDGIELSCAQFTVVAIESLICMLLFEQGTVWADFSVNLPYILYVGIFSSGVAYTLQILSQKGSNPTVVSLLLCTESFFAAVSGAVFLHERLSTQEYIGCALMLAAVVLAQIPPRKKGIE